MSIVQSLIETFQKDGWNGTDIYNRVLALREDKEISYQFLEQYLLIFEKSATFFDALLSYIDDHHLVKLLELVFCKKNLDIQSSVVESLIEYISLMNPILLHPYLEDICKRESNSYLAYFPWRDLDKNSIEYWKEKLQQSRDKQEQIKYVEILLQTRDKESVSYVYHYAKDNEIMEEDTLLYYMEDIGFTIKNGKIITYFSSPASHMVFEPHYIKSTSHPTWHSESQSISYRMGGEMLQSSPENPFCHILTLNPVPKNIAIGLNRIVFAMHIRELNEGYEPFYLHDKEGNPSKIVTEEEIEIVYGEDKPIKETSVSFAFIPQHWQRQDWALSNSRENLFRMGGEPTWVQSAHVPVCPKCNQKMHYIMQLDSILPDISDGEVWFGSGGIAYLFWCDACCVSGYTIQFT